MAFDSLAERLQETFKKLRGKGKLTEKDIKEAAREVAQAIEITCPECLFHLPEHKFKEVYFNQADLHPDHRIVNQIGKILTRQYKGKVFEFIRIYDILLIV